MPIAVIIYMYIVTHVQSTHLQKYIRGNKIFKNQYYPLNPEARFIPESNECWIRFYNDGIYFTTVHY